MAKSSFTKNAACIILTIFSVFIISGYAYTREVHIIDAHSQVDHKVNLESIITLMNKAGVVHTILSARGKVTPKQLVDFAKKHEGRITPAVRTKGQIYTDNSHKYYKILEKQLGMADFGAMAEVIMWHAQKGHKAPQMVVEPDDIRVIVALNAALEKKWPFIVHIEFEAAGPDRAMFKTKFVKMLKEYPTHPFVLIHMGQLRLAEANQLLKEHPNLYFITSHCNPVTVKSSNQPWVNLFNRGELSAEWSNLIIAFPGRFVLGFDSVFSSHWGKYYLKQVSLWKKSLSALPNEVAHAVAHRNAERLWKLSPIQ